MGRAFLFSNGRPVEGYILCDHEAGWAYLARTRYVRDDGIPAPVSRTLHFFSNPTSYLSNESSYKLHTAADGLTLWGYTSSDPAFIRAFFEILIRFIRGTFQPYLRYVPAFLIDAIQTKERLPGFVPVACLFGFRSWSRK